MRGRRTYLWRVARAAEQTAGGARAGLESVRVAWSLNDRLLSTRQSTGKKGFTSGSGCEEGREEGGRGFLMLEREGRAGWPFASKAGPVFRLDETRTRRALHAHPILQLPCPPSWFLLPQ